MVVLLQTTSTTFCCIQASEALNQSPSYGNPATTLLSSAVTNDADGGAAAGSRKEDAQQHGMHNNRVQFHALLLQQAGRWL